MLFSRFILGSLACLSLCVLVGCGGGSTTAEKTASEKTTAMGSSAPVAATASVAPSPTLAASPAAVPEMAANSTATNKAATNKLESNQANTKMDKMAAAPSSPSSMGKPVPAAKSASAQSEQVNFAAGSSSATLKGVVIRGDRKIYQLNAGKNQTMTVNLGSLENNGVFDLIGPDGKTLKQEATSAKQVLPASGDYQLVVGGTRGNVSYDLTVSIK